MTPSELAAYLIAAAFAASALGHAPALAQQTQAATAEEQPFGRAGDPKRISRTIRVTMDDGMRFSPSTLHVTRGETIRFEVTNAGKMMHEMVLGTMAQLKEHAEHMRTHGHMQHGDSHTAHVQPGYKRTLVWQFTRAGEFYYACLIPGHLEAGMIGKISVTPTK